MKKYLFLAIIIALGTSVFGQQRRNGFRGSKECFRGLNEYEIAAKLYSNNQKATKLDGITIAKYNDDKSIDKITKKQLFTYNDKNQIATESIYVLPRRSANSELVLKSKNTYTYYDDGKLKTISREHYNPRFNKLQQKSICEFNAEGIVLNKESYNYKNDDLIFGKKTEYIVDGDNVMEIHEYVKKPNAEDWIEVVKYNFFEDSRGTDLFQGFKYDPKTEKWNLFARRIITNTPTLKSDITYLINDVEDEGTLLRSLIRTYNENGQLISCERKFNGAKKGKSHTKKNEFEYNMDYLSKVSHFVIPPQGTDYVLINTEEYTYDKDMNLIAFTTNPTKPQGFCDNYRHGKRGKGKYGRGQGRGRHGKGQGNCDGNGNGKGQGNGKYGKGGCYGQHNGMKGKKLSFANFLYTKSTEMTDVALPIHSLKPIYNTKDQLDGFDILSEGEPFCKVTMFYSGVGNDSKNQLLGLNTIEETKYDIYPNPALNEISFQFANSNKEYQVKISTIDGKVHFNNKIKSGQEVDISKLPAGVYLCNVTINGKQVSKKLIVK
ncbi:MAG: T9SS type A sorting domain-containing protein [Hyphomicrobiales bacterium]